MICTVLTGVAPRMISGAGFSPLSWPSLTDAKRNRPLASSTGASQPQTIRAIEDLPFGESEVVNRLHEMIPSPEPPLGHRYRPKVSRRYGRLSVEARELLTPFS